MTDRFVVATGNKNKVLEFKRILNPLNIECVSASELGIDMDEVIEDGCTFKENSEKKALFAYSKCHLPVIADDSGLCVDALDGAPGVYSARYAGENADDRDKYNKLLFNLKDVPDDKRGAAFHCSITCILNDDVCISVEGICKGRIGFEALGNRGFGYDPIFIPYETGDYTMAQLGPEIKDKIGHRGKALRMFKDKLETVLNNEREGQ